MKADIGVIGLAVMGENLILNMADHGFKVAVFNRTVEKIDHFIQREKNPGLIATSSLEEFVEALSSPRKIFLMVQAGKAVDSFFEALIPLLSPGDILIDGGNSNASDSQRRFEELEKKGFLYVGVGISGGEEGARKGPSMMPGGSKKAWPLVQGIFQSIAASTKKNEPCCSWIGEGGSGHYVKMVHNGIEYGDMQAIAEIYALLRAADVPADQMAELFTSWKKGPLESYLIDITSDILKVKEKDRLLVDFIKDSAGQKGTGRWTVIEALDKGVALSCITESVFARFISARFDERQEAHKLYENSRGLTENFHLDLKDLEQALLFSKIISYTQGFILLAEASRAHAWNLDLGAIALVWREGCIIRSVFLEKIKEIYEKTPEINNLLFAPYFHDLVVQALPAVRRVLAAGILRGVAMPSMTAALSFFDAYTQKSLPANLVQAQRDYFGSHTYERLDRPRGEFFHTDWLNLRQK